ncbi:MAG TPA: YgiQ family radical SAM protein, partial [Ruminococcaceae bacterium]|nr:YgiQ family radical SAM protein [Oscillospiraceae bacterium]
PYTLKEVYVAKDEHDKALQRAMLQYFNPKNRKLVVEALRKAGRTDLIGNGPNCLIKPDYNERKPYGNHNTDRKKNYGKSNKKR